jgi:hypothetical protein
LALARKGLDGHFINLIHASIASPNFSVLINAKLILDSGVVEAFDRPLSPSLFVLAVNELSLTLQQALQDTLMFADDLLVCGKQTFRKLALYFTL